MEGAVPDTDAPAFQGEEHTMKRRTFLTGGAVAGASTLVAAPAIAQAAPEIKWRLTSSFPKSLDTIFGTAQTFAKYVADASDGKFQIQTFAAGEIVPGLQALDAVSTATVEMAQTPLYFYIGKEPALAYATEGSAVLHPDRGKLLRQLPARQDAQGLKASLRGRVRFNPSSHHEAAG